MLYCGLEKGNLIKGEVTQEWTTNLLINRERLDAHFAPMIGYCQAFTAPISTLLTVLCSYSCWFSQCVNPKIARIEIFYKSIPYSYLRR
jgi:hypothetical protein